MIDETQVKVLVRLERSLPELREQFKLLTKALDLATEYNPRQFQSLAVVYNEDDGRVHASWQGIDLTFVFVPGVSSAGRPQARIICQHTHTIFGKPLSEMIGTFVLNETGQTDFPPDERGNIPTIQGSADLIVLGHLELAMKKVEQRAVTVFAE
jgi:hypothetical protein